MDKENMLDAYVAKKQQISMKKKRKVIVRLTLWKVLRKVIIFDIMIT